MVYSNHTYLGDGVYVSADENKDIVLTTSEDINNDYGEIIYLDSEVIAALLKYIGELK